MVSDWPERKARLEEYAATMPGETPTRFQRDIRAALQRVEELEREGDEAEQEYTEQRCRAEAAEAKVEEQGQAWLNLWNQHQELKLWNQHQELKAKLANSEEECRWLEAQIRDLEAKLAKVVEAAEAYVEPHAAACCTPTPGDGTFPPGPLTPNWCKCRDRAKRLRAALAAAKERWPCGHERVHPEDEVCRRCSP